MYSGVTLFLELGNILSTKFEIEGNIEGAQGDKKFVYSTDEINTSFSQGDIIRICQEHQIDPRVINDFIVQPNDKGFSNNDPDKNPLLKKPIIKFEDNYYFVLISSQVTVLNEFIIQLSNKYNCNQKLTELYHDNYYRDWETDRKSTRLNSSHITRSRMPSSA